MGWGVDGGYRTDAHADRLGNDMDKGTISDM